MAATESEKKPKKKSNHKTPFVPGHTLSVDNGGGRPREYDYEKEADDLDKWSQADTSINLYAFTDRKPYLAQDLCDFAEKCPKFSLALRKAKERIARNREEKLAKGELHQAAFNRSASLHDRMLYHHEEHLKDRQAERDRGIKQEEATNFAKLLAAGMRGDFKQPD